MASPYVEKGITLARRIDRPDLAEEIKSKSGSVDIIGPIKDLMKEAPSELSKMCRGPKENWEEDWEEAFKEHEAFVDSLNLTISDL